jgi:hypothetical protein
VMAKKDHDKTKSDSKESRNGESLRCREQPIRSSDGLVDFASGYVCCCGFGYDCGLICFSLSLSVLRSKIGKDVKKKKKN